MIIVIARAVCQPGKRAALFEAARPVVEATRTEPGCISYALCADTSDENVALFVEQYASETACREHMAKPYTQALISGSGAFLAEAPTMVMHKVSASTDLLG